MGKDVLPVRGDVRCSRHLSESFQRAVALIAKRWTPLILFVLCERPRRFNEIADRIEFVSDRHQQLDHGPTLSRGCRLLR